MLTLKDLKPGDYRVCETQARRLGSIYFLIEGGGWCKLGVGSLKERQKGVSHCGPCKMYSYQEVGRCTFDHK